MTVLIALGLSDVLPNVKPYIPRIGKVGHKRRYGVCVLRACLLHRSPLTVPEDHGPGGETLQREGAGRVPASPKQEPGEEGGPAPRQHASMMEKRFHGVAVLVAFQLEMRKTLTDFIQVEFRGLKAQAEDLHAQIQTQS